MNCYECKNRKIYGWICWSGNKGLNRCNNGEPDESRVIYRNGVTSTEISIRKVSPVIGSEDRRMSRPPMKAVESIILNTVFHEDAYFDKTSLEKQRVCCNCMYRTKPDRCDIDGHFISYLACFTAWCRRWKKEKE